MLPKIKIKPDCVHQPHVPLKGHKFTEHLPGVSHRSSPSGPSTWQITGLWAHPRAIKATVEASGGWGWDKSSAHRSQPWAAWAKGHPLTFRLPPLEGSSERKGVEIPPRGFPTGVIRGGTLPSPTTASSFFSYLSASSLVTPSMWAETSWSLQQRLRAGEQAAVGESKHQDKPHVR